jgi:hypothetical protein
MTDLVVEEDDCASTHNRRVCAIVAIEFWYEFLVDNLHRRIQTLIAARGPDRPSVGRTVNRVSRVTDPVSSDKLSMTVPFYHGDLRVKSLHIEAADVGLAEKSEHKNWLATVPHAISQHSKQHFSRAEPIGDKQLEDDRYSSIEPRFVARGSLEANAAWTCQLVFQQECCSCIWDRAAYGRHNISRSSPQRNGTAAVRQSTMRHQVTSGPWRRSPIADLLGKVHQLPTHKNSLTIRRF